MLSPIKAVLAGVTVFAIGGALMIAQPNGEQAAVTPGAEVMEEEETDTPTSEIVNGFFSSFDGDGTDLEVPEFVITFPDGGEAVVQGIFTITGSFPNAASGDDTVTISGDGWELTGVVTMNGSHILEYYGSAE